MGIKNENELVGYVDMFFSGLKVGVNGNLVVDQWGIKMNGWINHD